MFIGFNVFFFFLNLGSGRGEAPSSTRSRSEGAKPLPAQGVGRYSTGVRPASQRAVFKVRRVCQHGSRRLPGSLCLSCPRSWFLAFSGRGVRSLLPRDSASPPPHPLPPPSFASRPSYPIRSPLWSSNACMSSLLISKLPSASVLIIL